MKMKRKIPASAFKAAANAEFEENQRERSTRWKLRYQGAFKTRYNISLQQTISKARSGNDHSLLKLIEWDKFFLYPDWARERILKAQWVADKKFLEDLSTAVRRSTCFYRKIKAKYRLLGNLVIALWNGFLLDGKNQESITVWRKKILEKLCLELKKAEQTNNEKRVLDIHNDLKIVANDSKFRQFIEDHIPF